MMCEVNVSVSSGNRVIECSGMVQSGVSTVLYADVREIDEIESIKIAVRPINDESETDGPYNVCIRNISIHSEEYNDDELQKMVISGELVNDSSSDRSDDMSMSLRIVSAFLIISISAVLGVWAGYALRKKFTAD